MLASQESDNVKIKQHLNFNARGNGHYLIEICPEMNIKLKPFVFQHPTEP